MTDVVVNKEVVSVRGRGELLKPTCRECNAEVRGPFWLYKSYDPVAGTFLCSPCRDRARDRRADYSCRKCGKVARVPPSIIQSKKLFDPETQTYLCWACSHADERIKVTCRHCGRSRLYWPSWIPKLKSFKESESGPTHLCQRCAALDNLRSARERLYWENGLSKTPTEEEKHAVHLQIFEDNIGEKNTDKRALNKVKAIKASVKVRSGGATENGQRRRIIHSFISRKRTGEFRRCPLCRHLIYLYPSRIKQDAKGFHDACYTDWQKSTTYRTWAGKIGSKSGPLAAIRIQRNPMPTPPNQKGRPVEPEALDEAFRWLLRHFYFSESWGDIASNTGGDGAMLRAAVLKRVSRFTSLLPDSWCQVFGGRKAAKHLDELLPIARLKGRSAGVPRTPSAA